VVFSLLLLIVVIFRQDGLMGMKEFSWDMIFDSPLARKLAHEPPKKGGK
jgi:branched-chain amino acid transport system permease protein